MPGLHLETDDRLDLSFVFASVLDERLDGDIKVVGHFTAVNRDITLHRLYRINYRLPVGADIVDWINRGVQMR